MNEHAAVSKINEREIKVELSWKGTSCPRHSTCFAHCSWNEIVTLGETQTILRTQQDWMSKNELETLSVLHICS
jgi:hypothetical protein